jgi:hypothetical protein
MRTGKELSKIKTSLEALGAKLETAWARSSEAFAPMRLRMARRLHKSLTRLPFYPVEVPERPVPTEENPKLAEKVAEMRCWMQEHGIGEPLARRKPPLAVGLPRAVSRTPPAAKRQGGDGLNRA